MSPIDYSSKKSDTWLKLPPDGIECNFGEIHGPIVSAEKVEGGKGFNFIKKEVVNLPGGGTAKADVDCGYHYLYVFEDGKKLTLNSWCPFYAFMKAQVQEGDRIIVNHLAKGKWEVTKS